NSPLPFLEDRGLDLRRVRQPPGLHLQRAVAFEFVAGSSSGLRVVVGSSRQKVVDKPPLPLVERTHRRAEIAIVERSESPKGRLGALGRGHRRAATGISATVKASEVNS